MERKPFSVVISVYKNDDPACFDLALQSITEEQTVQPDEVVLIVDGPVPEQLSAVVDRYEAEYKSFRVFRLPENVGLGNAMQLAVEKAQNELVARMDSDDISAPNRFCEQLRFFQENDAVDVVGGDISEFVEEEENIVAYRRVPKEDADIKNYMKKRCPLNHVTVMFKKTAVQAAGGYRELFWNEDYYLWIRMAERGAVMANTGTVLVNVRTGKDMYSRRGGKRYFKSELFLQNYMLKKGIIGPLTYVDNVVKRWIVQRLLPNKIRGWVFRTLARKEH